MRAGWGGGARGFSFLLVQSLLWGNNQMSEDLHCVSLHFVVKHDEAHHGAYKNHPLDPQK